MNVWTATTVTFRLIGGGIDTRPRCQHRDGLSQCSRVEGHGDDNAGKPGYWKLTDGHLMRWGRDPNETRINPRGLGTEVLA